MANINLFNSAEKILSTFVENEFEEIEFFGKTEISNHIITLNLIAKNNGETKTAKTLITDVKMTVFAKNSFQIPLDNIILTRKITFKNGIESENYFRDDEICIYIKNHEHQLDLAKLIENNQKTFNFLTPNYYLVKLSIVWDDEFNWQ